MIQILNSLAIFAFLELSAFVLYNIVANEVLCDRFQAFADFRFALPPLHFEKQIGTSSGDLGSDHPALPSLRRRRPMGQTLIAAIGSEFLFGQI